MLRQSTALLLLLAFVASTFSKAVVVAGFYANQDYIAKNLCENRDNPKMRCCGRCLLRKRLARENNQDQNNPEGRAVTKEVLFIDQLTGDLDAPFATMTTFPYAAYPVRRPIDRRVEHEQDAGQAGYEEHRPYAIVWASGGPTPAHPIEQSGQRNVSHWWLDRPAAPGHQPTPRLYIT